MRLPIQPKALPVVYTVARYYAAYTLFSYGFAKVMGAQFTVLDSQLAKPMGDVSGFWLTWYYFGYSSAYASLVAWCQLIGAGLLCFRRTTLLGALLLLPLMVNIVAIDVWVIHFPYASGALRNAVFVLCALLIVVAFHGRELQKILTVRRDDLALLAGVPRWGFLVPLFITIGMVAYTAHQADWLANVNNRAPTPIDGAWRVKVSQPGSVPIPEWIYFEYNRAHMAVFQFPNGRTETHDFRVDPRAKTLKITEEWLALGSEIFNGHWSRTGDEMVIDGVWRNAIPVVLTLERKQMSVKDHQ